MRGVKVGMRMCRVCDERAVRLIICRIMMEVEREVEAGTLRKWKDDAAQTSTLVRYGWTDSIREHSIATSFNELRSSLILKSSIPTTQAR